MKQIVLATLIVAFVFGCVNNSEEDLIDCSQSTLAIDDIASVKSGCGAPGSLTVEVSGGEGPYSFSVDGENFQTSATISDLVAGLFQVTVQDALGCSVVTDFTLLSEDSSITLALDSENSGCSSADGTITASATGGEGAISFSLDGGNFQSDNSFSGLGPGEYEIAARDEAGCEVSTNVTIGTNTELASDIMPIISSNCAISGCHDGSISPDLTTTSRVISNAGRIKSQTQSGNMPRGRNLSSTQIDLIACWVDDGAKNN